MIARQRMCDSCGTQHDTVDARDGAVWHTAQRTVAAAMSAEPDRAVFAAFRDDTRGCCAAVATRVLMHVW